MKPIKLEIEGLNSFEENQILDFDKIGSGVFGIFGKTGSGKSTILDAITLSLYGKVERTKQNVDFVNTKRSKAIVDFVFEVFHKGKTRRFRANRVFSRKKNGKDLDASASLYEIDGEQETLIEEGTVKVNDKIFDIVGLGEREFEKCIALPQGEFSAFLQAKPSERTEIMSNIFDLTRFGEPLAEKVKQKINEYDKEVSVITAQKQMVDYATVEALSEAEQKATTAKAELQEKQQVLFDKKQELAESESSFEKIEKLAGIIKNLSELEEKKAEMQALETNMAFAQSANEIRSDYEKLKKDKADEKELTAKISELNEVKLTLASELQRTEIEFVNFKDIYSAKIAELSAKLARLQDIKKFESEKESLEKEREEIEQKIKAKEKELYDARQENDYIISLLTTIQGKITKINEFIEANKPDVDLSYALEQTKGIESELLIIDDFYKKIESRIDENENDLKQAREEYDTAITNEKVLQAKQLQIQKSIEVAFEDYDTTEFKKLRSCDQQLQGMTNAHVVIEKINEFIVRLQSENEQRKQILGAIEAQIEVEQAKLDDINRQILGCEKTVDDSRREREELLGENVISMISNHLRIGDNCPVCAGKVVQKMQCEENDLSNVQASIDEGLSNVKLSRLERDKAMAEIVSLKSRFEFEKNQIEKNLSEIDSLSASKENYLQKFVDVGPTAEENFYNLFELLKRTSDSLEELISLQDDLRLQEKDVLIQKTQAGTKVAIFRGIQESLIDIIYDLQKKKAEREFAISSVNERYENLKEYKRQIAEGKNIEIEIDTKKEERIKLKDEQLRLTDQKASSDASIAEKKTEKEVLLERLNSTDKQISALKAKIISSGVPENVSVDEEDVLTQKEISRLKLDYEAKQMAHESAKEKLSRTENDFKVNTTILDEKRAEIAMLEQKVSTDMARNDFASFDALEKCFVDQTIIKNNQAKINEYNDSVRLLTSQKTALEAEHLQSVDKSKIEELGKEIVVLEESTSELSKELGKLDADFERTKKDNQKLAELSEKLKVFTSKFDTAKELASVLRGKALAEYACEEYLEEITTSANQKLGLLLDGRYTLKFENKEFYVEDNFNDGKTRPASTLSGGETFIVSLSLALSISDAISMLSTKSMDFFFLDEGFGTLDSELCTVVADALHKLESQNLRVGIISHVQELEESVKNKVIVTKEATGTKIKLEHSL